MEPGSVPVLERSSGEGNGYTAQYSCLENSMDREAYRLFFRVPESVKESKKSE